MAKPTDELLDHSFDGIQEYNNPMPLWWIYLFILTIIWSFIYIFYYEISSIGDNSAQEYAKEMKIAEEKQLASIGGLSTNMSFSQADLNPITETSGLDAGKAVFIKNCVACHGKFGEGGVGPNLTDDYWIHGGKFENIATTIMNGVPEKGMITWKTVLKKAEILQVASYILTLRGTNPPNAKAAQGQLFTP
ncbi:MAG: cbb3-type cytochrome c oxidase N-terminal domain-containing protein [Bacteroidota bacterium]